MRPSAESRGHRPSPTPRAEQPDRATAIESVPGTAPSSRIDQRRHHAPRRANALATIVKAIRMTFTADRRGFVTAGVLQLIGALAPTGLVVVGQRLIQTISDAPSGRPKLGDLVVPVILLAAVTAVTLVTTSVQALQQRYLGERVASYMWDRVIEVSTRVRLEAFETPRFFDRLERLKEVAFVEPVTVTNGVFGLIGSVVGAVGLLVVLFVIDPVLPLLLVAAGVPSVLLSRVVARLEFSFAEVVTPIFRAREYLRETLTGRAEAKEIRVFGADRALRARHDGRVRDYQRTMLRHVHRRQRYALGDVVLTAIVLAFTLGYVVYLVSHGTLSLAQAAAAILAVRFASTSLSALFTAVGDLFESAVFLDDLDGFINDHPDLEPLRTPDADLPALTGAVELTKVSFGYPGGRGDVLHDIDLRIGAHEIVALVGENGSGKTTLAKLVAGLYRPRSGTMRWDGVDLSATPAAAVREHVSAIFQDFVKYELSAQDNVGLGDPDRAGDEAAARRAAQQADATGFLDALPLGMATILSKEYEDGQDLSQGQWQRVALARALRKDSSLVILDEPTASLDPRAEAQLYGDIRRTLNGRAALLISHRFSSVRLADRIYVLRDGRIVEVGTHESLIAARGLYAELFRIQAEAYR